VQKKRVKREAAEKRNAAYSKLPLAEKLARNSKKVRAKLQRVAK